ncbi:hypothetical protein KKF34_16440 [Myxococcota bacterium]|nr:hypothetical protein [Myxococcota bacterium]MBU1381957.1 hypothetical protein [Myxococcota bacterium]MBU1498467.1 hypothetical protein [Myxococcota bacterium]
MKNFLILAITILAISCSGSGGKTTTMPVQKSPPEAILNTLKPTLNMESPSGMVREGKETATDIKSALSLALNLYPQYKEKIECWTTVDNFFLFSLKTNDEKLPPCSYVQILFVKKGSSKVFYYWPL